MLFRFGDEKKLMQFHQELEDVIEDQLSLGIKLIIINIVSEH